VSDSPFVSPAGVPELAPIIRAGLRSKVRLFDLWCTKGDRVLEVLHVAGRPIAISRSDRLRHVVHVDDGHEQRWYVEGGFDGRWGGRNTDVSMWVDGLAVLPSLPCSCAHERISVRGEWLRRQLAEGVRKRVLDQATRAEIGPA
jgi:hypothetical protein